MVICLGPGGVGKTTISAALAMRGVQEGRAVDVMTVDPAPRLLDALGSIRATASRRRYHSTESRRGGCAR
jgi:anion-transporting  ArsA/GET3 family ATPase